MPHAPNATPVWTVYTYDGSTRTLSVASPDGSATTYAYKGNTVKVTDPAGNWKTFTMNAMGNLTSLMKNLSVQVFLFLGFLSTLVAGGDIRYFREAPFAFDFATLISKTDFNEPYLIRLFRDFANSERKKHRISRLTVGVHADDLSAALPAGAFRYFNVGPAYSSEWNDQNFVAQVFCLNGSASAIIKIGSAVKSVQVLGDRDPRELTVHGRSVYILALRIVTSNIFFDRPYYARDDDWISIYAVSNPLLTAEEGAQVLGMLQTAIGPQVVLEVRSDALFAPSDGPPFDLFHPPFPDVAESEYKVRPQLTCVPPNLASPERRKRGVCEIVRPIDLPQVTPRVH